MKLNDFLFVTCLTPSASLSPLRKKLFELYKEGLERQDSKNWTAVLMGEEERTEGNFIFLKAKTLTKEDKLLELHAILTKLEKKPKFIIRLDDDDIFSSTLLSKIEKGKLNFDVYTDKYQSMFNVSDLKGLKKEYPWFPSTLVMKYEDAVTIINGFNGLPLFVCDHNLVYHEYYKNKKVWYAEKDEPIYLRIFSPTSLSFSDSKKEFEKYCRSFGVWKFISFNGFDWVMEKLLELNKEYFKTEVPNKALHNATAEAKALAERVKRKLSGK